MTTPINDELAKLLNDDTHSERHDVWLWLHLIINNAALPFSEAKNAGMRDQMAQVISMHPQIIETIKQKRNEQLIHHEHFNWISESKRQAKWLLSNVDFYTGNYNLPPPPGLTDKKLLIAKIDLWIVDITKKALAVSDLKAKWTEHIKGDSFFEWFKDDHKKCILAWAWLNKNATLTTWPHQQFDNYEGLLTYFDNSGLIPDQKTLYIEKIKRKWSQQKYRENLTGKAQYNFVLSNEAFNCLDKVAKTHRLSRTQILELLLQIESEKNLCAQEIFKRQKLLDAT